jgi:hypothetical protein
VPDSFGTVLQSFSVRSRNLIDLGRDFCDEDLGLARVALAEGRLKYDGLNAGRAA